SKSGARIAGDRLDVDVIETTAGLERPDQKNIQKNSSGHAERARSGLLLKIGGQLEDDFFEEVLGTAGKIGAKGGAEGEVARGEAEFAVKGRGKDAAMLRTGSEIATIESGKAVGPPGEKFAEGRKEFRLTILAEPLELVFVAARPESGKFGDPRVEPAERIGKFQRLQRADVVAFPYG